MHRHPQAVKERFHSKFKSVPSFKKGSVFSPLENCTNQNSTSKVKQVKLTKYTQNIALSQ